MSTRTALVVLGLALAVGSAATTQRVEVPDSASAPGPRLSFEVVSIRPCTDNLAPGYIGGGSSSLGRLTVNCQPVSGYIQMAYLSYADGRLASDPNVVFNTPIEGGPGWVNSERYTITAKAADAASPGTMMGPMTRTLLEDRFKLRIRRESREIPVYALTVARGGPRLQPFQEGSCVAVPVPLVEPLAQLPPGQRYCAGSGLTNGPMPNSVIALEGVTLDRFVQTLGSSLMGVGRPVINETGLTGKFNIRLEYAPPPVDPARFPQIAAARAAAGEPTAPSIETALQEQLGLKLESAKGVGSRLVIESIERPSEN
jgi:uncharacterized protein (TIGR03435 family)